MSPTNQHTQSVPVNVEQQCGVTLPDGGSFYQRKASSSWSFNAIRYITPGLSEDDPGSSEEQNSPAEEVPPTENIQLISKIVQWLAYSTRTLYIEELAELVTISETGIDVKKCLSNPRSILTICPDTLIATTPPIPTNPPPENEFKPNQHQIHFTDPSIKQYLQSPEILQSNAQNHLAITEATSHTTIAKDSLTYLLQFTEPYTTTPSKIKISYLLSYATNYWAVHARLAHAETDPELTALILRFLASGTAYLNWTAFLDGYTPFSGTDGSSLIRHSHQIYYAASFGLTNIVTALLDTGAPVNSRGPSGSALAAAALAGHLDTVKVLVDSGADVNLAGPFGTPLVLASGRGFVDIVRFLVERGADVEARGEWSETALVEARKNGFEDVVGVLLGR
ncbi:ankyrin repeat-containing protein [Aspergillus flavus]|uniref:Ankyrin repeat-containing protein n=1 Tax=Aspergillus flavus TaxID=5059 RepID=A0AB74CHZ9_ASPFL|nr:ankyrin repeat-containing protein [Aspergillus flavus]RAQ80397.1 ankyrin repeat-containing protein [Aspergillus flavus]RMZ46289.1 ankyrin repeat-containing protein [Aspergillus flavus]